MKQVGNTILAKGGNHILAKRDNSAWPKGSKLSGFSTSKGIAVEKMPFLKDKKLVIPTKDLFPCAPERFSNMIDNNFCVRLKKQELTEEEYIEQKEEYLKTGDAKIIIYALNVRHSDAIHLEEMQVMTEETRQQNDGKLFKKLPLLCEQIGIGTLTVSEYLHRNGFFIDK